MLVYTRYNIRGVSCGILLFLNYKLIFNVCIYCGYNGHIICVLCMLCTLIYLKYNYDTLINFNIYEYYSILQNYPRMYLDHIILVIENCNIL